MEVCKDHNADGVMNVDPIDVQCPENVVWKEELMDLDLVINEIQNKFYFLNNKASSWQG